jgi:hypothetical protein
LPKLYSWFERILRGFGTHLELAWNIVGTISVDCQLVIRYFGTSVELGWNLGGTWGVLTSSHPHILKREKSTYRFIFFKKNVNW